ncbi:MAG: hypothetical protein K0R03_1721 [Moraxellaceae bacterium]|jgi:hypothetical protein|nr:hypothetical protein [Moraxellaceae bacterium]
MTVIENAVNAGTAPVGLVDSARVPKGLRGVQARLLGGVMARVFGVVRPGDVHARPEPLRCPPHAGAGPYGVTHYGVMIPDLPAPHHFLACAAILGGTGMRAFDNDAVAQRYGGPRRAATLVHGTAAAVDGHFTHYALPEGMTLKEDGSLLRFGAALELSGRYPAFRVRSERPGFALDLALTATGECTWFAHSAVYQHLSLLTRYHGTLTHEGKVLPVAGLCTYEYARGLSPYAFVNRSLPPRLKLPWDFFSYQVINLDADTQLLFAHCEVMGAAVLTGAYLRRAGGGAERIDGDVRLRVLTTQAAPGVAPDGRETALPRTFRWSVQARSGRRLFEIDATVDTPMLFGIGAGFVGGFRWEGRRDGRPAAGRGYIEYVDRREA